MRQRFVAGLFVALVAVVPLRAADSVIDDAGVPIKVITVRDTSLRAKPLAGSKGSPVEIFRYFYVLPPIANTKTRLSSKLGSLTQNGFYRVASSDREVNSMGWLPAKDVIVWYHREALRPAQREGREPISFYATREEAIAAAKTGNTSTATHREPADSAGKLILMPILSAEPVRIEGEKNTVYKVAFVSRAPTGGPGAATHAGHVLTREQVAQQATMDVVFVVDTTSSMENPIAQVRRSIFDVVQSLINQGSLKGRLRLGLVGYRDVHPNLGYVAKVFCTLEEGAEPRIFLERLSALEVTNVIQPEYAEDVLAGLALAMDKDKLHWNPVSWKQLVIVGDSSVKAPDHPFPVSRENEGGRTIDSILDTAQGPAATDNPANSFVISSVHIKDPIPALAPDQEIAEQQLGRLVAGRKYHGKLITAIGGLHPEDFSRPLAASLAQAIEAFAKGVLGKELVLDTDISPEKRLTSADFPYPVLDMIRRLPGDSASGGGGFTERYVTELDSKGNRVLIPHLFTRRGRLQSFVSFLDLLHGLLEDAGEPGSRDLESILNELKTVTAVLEIDEPVTGDLKLDRIAAGLLDIPVKADIFRLSIGDLAAMNREQYAAWLTSMQATRQNLQLLIDNPTLWFRLHPAASERDTHAFVPLSQLP